MEINRVLIANRGAIAVRIIRTLKTMGIEAVAVYAEADRESLHVRNADHAFSLGSGGATNTYLDQQKIIEIALKHNVNAIHPGYGFLSENTEFVERCEANNLVFLGPNTSQIEAFGLKHRARELAAAADVPLLPGSGILKNADDAQIHASTIGYPVMLKSTAGGGGIGMQLCESAQELSNAWDSVSALSANNFANADLFIEKFVKHARHVEVQIFGDGQGNAIAIGERDCSAQRRNQKVLEETPAPNLSDAVRQSLHSVAVNLVKSINYRSAGTVEFILDADSQKFYFLEVNTRLQVEHGVTEEIYNIDIVRWMIELAAGQLSDLTTLAKSLKPKGHAIQARVYAEDPNHQFQPSAGLLSEVSFPEPVSGQLRIDHWLEAGIEISPFFDPMLAKVIAIGDNRDQALNTLQNTLRDTRLYGIETNVSYLVALLSHPPFVNGECLTATLAGFSTTSNTIDVLSPGTMTTIQDSPGRVGYWDIGVPPSGPFDSLSFQLGNRLLGNDPKAAGLELTINGAHLQFSCDCKFVLTGAEMDAALDDEKIVFRQIITARAGQQLRLGKVLKNGARSYLLFAGGIACPDYMGSKATFTLGQFGGHAGRALRSGDVLHLAAPSIDPLENEKQPTPSPISSFTPELATEDTKTWQIRVIPGPQGAPDFFEHNYIEQFFDTDWKVHYNSSRTGVRLIGPKPQWTRSDGGEAGMHPSNIHDNAYAIGAIDFTGDMPVILGPDGPSLGGFVCPATVISADLWKIGQLTAGDKLRFVPVSTDAAVQLLNDQQNSIAALKPAASLQQYQATARQAQTTNFDIEGTPLTLRQSGDANLLIEFGPPILDIELRFQVHRLMLALQDEAIAGIKELTPGIRSLQIHYDCLKISLADLNVKVRATATRIAKESTASVPSRIVHLPLSWDDEQCQLAIEKYHQSVRQNAPWHPSNIEFIRRINGMQSIEDVKQTVFDASYLVMGLGDVYLGAPVATPIDPAHRLVTTKYNPARTWTAENSVGIGGSYLCIYGMEGPGGYQFVGRTLQMWNRYRQTKYFPKPWLLRFFDQIRFYPVSGEELLEIRKDFPLGQYPIKIEHTEFNLSQYKALVADNQERIKLFTEQRENAFEQELQDWKNSGQFHFEEKIADEPLSDSIIPEGMIAIESPVAGNIWQLKTEVGKTVKVGDPLLVLESMKMEIEITAHSAGTVDQILHQPGAEIATGVPLVIIKPAKPQ